MDHTNYIVEPMISAKSIAARCEELAEDISLYFKNTDKLIVVGLLRGSFVFIADLARELDLPCEVDFLETSSYGNSTESSREVRILKDLRGEIEGRDVLVIEDIVDTGHTLHHVKTLLELSNMMEEVAPEYAKKLPKKELPNFMVKLFSYLDSSAKTMIPDLELKMHVDTSYTEKLLDIKFKTPKESISDMTKSVIRLGMV